MTCLETVPSNWKRSLVLSAVPKDGTAYEDKFTVEEKNPVSYWGQNYKLTSPLDVKIRVYRTEGSIYTDISVSGKVSAPCARCLEAAETDFSGELKYLFSLSSDEENRTKDEKDGTSDGDEDIIVLDSWEDEINLAPQIWEVMIVSLPAVILCKEDCKGLCPECGANLNSEKCGCKKSSGDVRFEVLKQFICEK